MKKKQDPTSGNPAPEKWVVEFLDERVEAEFDEFSADIQAKLTRISDLIEAVGLPAVKEPYVKQLDGKLWEMRAQDAASWGRSLYCAVKGRRVVILRCFSKKTNKTPRREIDLALERMKGVR